MTAKEQGLPELPESVAGYLDAYFQKFGKAACDQFLESIEEYARLAVSRYALASDTGERGVVASVCDGCPHLATEYWRDYLDNDETDSGTKATCNAAKRCIDVYWRAGKPSPDWCPAAALRAQPAGGWDVGYSLDADPRGIRAATADAITGALAFGAQGSSPPPAGHWLLPFWKAARADASGWLTVLDLLRTDSNGKKWDCIASRAGSWVDVSPYFEPQQIASPDGADAFAYGASALTQPQPVTPPESGGQGEAVPSGYVVTRIPDEANSAPPHYMPNEAAAYIAGWNWCRAGVIAAENIYTHPPAQASGAVTDEQALEEIIRHWGAANIRAALDSLAQGVGNER